MRRPEAGRGGGCRPPYSMETGEGGCPLAPLGAQARYARTSKPHGFSCSAPSEHRTPRQPLPNGDSPTVQCTGFTYRSKPFMHCTGRAGTSSLLNLHSQPPRLYAIAQLLSKNPSEPTTGGDPQHPAPKKSNQSISNRPIKQYPRLVPDKRPHDHDPHRVRDDTHLKRPRPGPPRSSRSRRSRSSPSSSRFPSTRGRGYSKSVAFQPSTKTPILSTPGCRISDAQNRREARYV